VKKNVGIVRNVWKNPKVSDNEDGQGNALVTGAKDAIYTVYQGSGPGLKTVGGPGSEGDKPKGKVLLREAGHAPRLSYTSQ